MSESDKKMPEQRALIKVWLLPIVAMVILLVMVAWMAGLFDEKVQPGLNDPLAVNVDRSDLVIVEAKDLTIYEPVPASVEAKFATLISSRLLARITQVHARAGDSVKAGQVLVSLEKSDLLAKAQQAKENSRAVEARLTEAKQNLERIEKLNNQRLVALADVDKARANEATLVAELALARQQEQEAATALSYTDIRSPIDGRLVDRFAEPGDTATPGTPLLSLYNPLSLRVESYIREQLALSLEIGQSLEVNIPSLKQKVTAIIEEIVPAANTGSRSFLVKARIDYDKSLLPGMYARMLIPSRVEKTIVIPKNRVVQVGQLDLVWVVQDDQIYRRFIRVGKALDGDNGEKGSRIEVLAGLTEGDRLLLPPLLSAQKNL